jgi:hypothetical protein
MDFVKHALTCHVHLKVAQMCCCVFRGKVARSTRTVQNFSPDPRAGFAQALWEEHYIFAHTSRNQQ